MRESTKDKKRTYGTCSGVQKMCASSWQKRRTLVKPPSAPECSLRCNAPKSAQRMGSSRQERTLCSYIKLHDNKHTSPFTIIEHLQSLCQKNLWNLIYLTRSLICEWMIILQCSNRYAFTMDFLIDSPVGGAVHRFQSKGMRLTGHCEHILTVMLPVSWPLP